MKILAVGVSKPILYSSITFRSPTSFLDYDVVIWNPSTLFNEYKDHKEPLLWENPKLADSDKKTFFEDIERRKDEFNDLLNMRKVIVIFLPSPQECIYWSGSYTDNDGNKFEDERYGGSKTFYHFNILQSLPLDIETKVSEGNLIESIEKEPYRTYHETTKEIHHYTSILKTNIGTPFLFVKGTKKAVASYIHYNNGIILLLPSIKLTYTQKATNEAWKLFINALTALITDIRRNEEDYIIPEWAKKYLLDGEQSIIQKLSEKEENLNQISSQIAQIQKELAHFEKYKILLSGTGEILEKQVSKVLEEIGFSLVTPDAFRDDIVLKYEDKVV